MQTDAAHPASCRTDPIPCNNPKRFRWGAQRTREVLERAGAMLRDARNRQGLSLRAVAEKVGKSHVFIGDVERGISALPIDLVPRMCDVLNLDPADVLCAFRLVPERAAAKFFDPDRMREALKENA